MEANLLMANTSISLIPRTAFSLIVFLAGLTILIIFPGCSQPVPRLDRQKPFFFVQISDTQLGLIANNKNFTAETKLYEAAVAHINRLGPAFVVNTGDLINKTHDQQQTDELLRITGNIDPAIPIYWVAGNHDIGDAPTWQSLNWYRSHMGEDWYSFDIGPCHFIVLNSCLLKDPQNVPDQEVEQRLWLQQDLAQAAWRDP